MANSLLTSAISAARQVTRDLRGEAVTLLNAAGAVVASIDDAVVTMDGAAVGGIGTGPAQHSGVLRLDPTHRTNALNARTAEVRGYTWNVVDVAEPLNGAFRVEIRRDEAESAGNHTNIFDLEGNQAVWAEE